MKLQTFIKKNNQVLLLVSLGLLLLALFYYSNSKSNISEKYSAWNPKLNPATFDGTPMENDTSYASINDVDKTSLPQSSTPVINPIELLPKDNNSEWNKLNPTSNIGGGNFISPQARMVSSTPKRNVNLQLRSDPPVPQKAVSPWNNTTIGRDDSRRQFDIGVKCTY